MVSPESRREDIVAIVADEAGGRMTVDLPGDLVMRAPTMGDLAAVNALNRACEADEYGVPESTEDDLRGAWERARFDLTRDAWLVVQGGGRPAGYADGGGRQ